MTVEDLRKYELINIAKMPCIGKTTFLDLINTLKRNGFALREIFKGNDEDILDTGYIFKIDIDI